MGSIDHGPQEVWLGALQAVGHHSPQIPCLGAWPGDTWSMIGVALPSTAPKNSWHCLSLVSSGMGATGYLQLIVNDLKFNQH